MRIVSYNILDGGEGRADPLAEVIEAQRPDVVALVEADHLFVVERIANRLGMDFIHAPGNGDSVALLSRWPILTSINHALLHKEISKSFLQATVADPAGGEWVLGVVHLHARASIEDETKREKELDVLLEVLAPHRRPGVRHVLAGDFNSNSPVQQIDPKRVKPRTRDEWEANGGMIPRRVVQHLLEAGYVDSLHEADPAIAASAGTFTTQCPGQRVDYIFPFGRAIPIRSAWVEQDRLAKYASDHFPIGAELAPSQG